MNDQPEPVACDYTKDGLRCTFPVFGRIESHAPTPPYGVAYVNLCAYHLGAVAATIAEFATWKPKESDGQP